MDEQINPRTPITAQELAKNNSCRNNFIYLFINERKNKKLISYAD
jgi:hypothetical protein